MLILAISDTDLLFQFRLPDTSGFKVQMKQMLQTALYSNVCNIVMSNEKAPKLCATIIHRKLLGNHSFLTTHSSLLLPVVDQFWHFEF